MESTGRIQAVAPAHYAQWRPLWDAYLDFYGVQLRPEVTEATWRRLLAPDSDHKCLVHHDDAGAVTAFVIYLFHRSSWTDTWNCYIEDLYVASHARGRRIARRLLDAVFQDADARKSYRIYWQTDRGNEAARRLYDQVADVADVVQYRVGPRT
jgi:GNAT superfamily N-acetyltransferase